jgi:adenylate cyclase class IV
VKSHRISYELGNIDFDIDKFPNIPAFLEIDIENLEISVEELLKKLDLDSNEVVVM